MERVKNVILILILTVANTYGLQMITIWDKIQPKFSQNLVKFQQKKNLYVFVENNINIDKVYGNIQKNVTLKLRYL